MISNHLKIYVEKYIIYLYTSIYLYTYIALQTDPNEMVLKAIFTLIFLIYSHIKVADKDNDL